MTAGRINQVSFVFQCNQTVKLWYTSALKLALAPSCDAGIAGYKADWA